MQIHIGQHTLVRGLKEKEIPFDFRIQGQREVQVVSTVRADHVKAYDRGNLRTLITFRVVRHHSSAEWATRYVLMHASSLQGLEGHLTLVAESGDDPVSYYLHHASVRSVESYPMGVCSHHHYAIIGGALTQEKPKDADEN